MESDVDGTGSSIQDERDKEMCAIALDEAFSLCGNNTVIFEQIAAIMGIRKTDLNSVTPLDSKYRGILNGARYDTKWAIARAWDLVVNEKAGVMEAFNQAWEEVEASKEPVPPAAGRSPMPGVLPGEPTMDEFPAGPL